MSPASIWVQPNAENYLHGSSKYSIIVILLKPTSSYVIFIFIYRLSIYILEKGLFSYNIGSWPLRGVIFSSVRPKWFYTFHSQFLVIFPTKPREELKVYAEGGFLEWALDFSCVKEKFSKRISNLNTTMIFKIDVMFINRFSLGFSIKVISFPEL